MLLVVDIGNSYSKFKMMNSDFSYSLKTSLIESCDILKSVFPVSKISNKVTGAIISSVSLNKDVIVKEFLDNAFNINSLIINHNLNYEIKYPIKNELGSDLIALMEGASLFSKTHLTISLGTATVFNLVIEDNYVGTAISPGVLTSLGGLIDSASYLNETKLDEEYNLLGLDTDEALRTGLLNGFTYLIDGFIDSIKEKYKLDDLDIYLVGGFSNTFYSKLKNKCILKDDLIFQGLNKIYELNS